jgi:colicin import membrane protein
MTAAAASIFEERADPGRVLSALLAAAMHAVLFLVLIFGVRWQNRPPEAVQVELWNPPAEALPVEEPKPVPKVEPAPPVFVKPEPEVPKPEIVEKKAPPPPKPKPVAKVEPKVEPKPVPVKPVAKAVPLKPRVDESKRFQEELAREQASLAVDGERQRLREQAASDATAARNKTMADWVGKVAAKVRGNVVLPPDIKGNPEAIFDVVQLPNGEVLQVKLRKSSGHRALDDAIERAILKSSPLPRPDKAETAPRAFELKYRPLEP